MLNRIVASENISMVLKQVIYIPRDGAAQVHSFVSEPSSWFAL